jgi:sortase A
MRRRSSSVLWAVLSAIVLPIAAAGCAQGGQERTASADGLSLDAAPSSAPAATQIPTTPRPSTTSSSTTTSTSSTTTTLAPTTVETLPTPQPPPKPRAAEPYNQIGSIRVPKLGIDSPLLEGITLTTLDQGPGHWPGTAMPGRLGNVVVAGHRTSHGAIFRNIDQLVQGDEVIFATSDGEFRYLVDRISIVQPDAMYIISQTPERTATLFACHPPGSTRQRIVAHLVLAN